MGSLLVLELANIILTKFEKAVMTSIMESAILKFNCRCVKDMLILVKEAQTDQILKAFNSFHNNLQLAVDKFKNEDVHFLYLKIMNNGKTNIYVKDTNCGLYINYNSYEP